MEVFKTVLDLGEKKLRETEKVAKEKALKFDTSQRDANVITFCYQQTALTHTHTRTHTHAHTHTQIYIYIRIFQRVSTIL
jgi:hypothetical protein